MHDFAREKNLAFLNAHLGTAPIERLLDHQAPKHQSGLVIAAREAEFQPVIDTEEPMLDDSFSGPQTIHYVEIIQDGAVLTSLSAMLPPPDADDEVRTNVMELIADDEDTLDILRMCLDTVDMPRSRMRPH